MLQRWSFAVLMGVAMNGAVMLVPTHGVVLAASPAWPAYTTAAKRPLFRPWSRVVRQGAVTRWRPQGAGEIRIARPAERVRTAAAVVVLPPVASVRTAPTEPQWGYEAPRFRPDRRALNAKEEPGMSGQRVAYGGFRPTAAPRKHTYEQLRQIQSRTLRAAGYPVVAHPVVSYAYPQPWPAP